MPVTAGRLLEVGVAVTDLTVASENFKRLFSAPLSAPIEEQDNFALRFTMCRVDRADFEIMESARSDGLIARFVARQGEGLHHVAFEIEDAEAAMRELRAMGAPVLGETPVLMANLKAFFLHPSCFGGILVEFVQNLHPWLDGVVYDPGDGPVGIEARRIAGVTATVADVDMVAAALTKFIGATAAHEANCPWVKGAARTCRIGDIDLTLAGAGPGDRTGLRYVTVEVDDVDVAASRLTSSGATVLRRGRDGTQCRSAYVEHAGLHGMPMVLIPSEG